MNPFLSATGVWTDFYDLESSLQCLKRRIQSQLGRSMVTALTGMAVNLPVAVSFAVLLYQLVSRP